jgi:hypothetical protein
MRYFLGAQRHEGLCQQGVMRTAGVSLFVIPSLLGDSKTT